MLAGAKTLVMSLWKVPDQQTQKLMEDFYRRILAGQGRANALREAQLALKAWYPDPLYWGAFICKGEPGPLAGPDFMNGRSSRRSRRGIGLRAIEVAFEGDDVDVVAHGTRPLARRRVGDILFERMRKPGDGLGRNSNRGGRRFQRKAACFLGHACFSVTFCPSMACFQLELD